MTKLPKELLTKDSGSTWLRLTLPQPPAGLALAAPPIFLGQGFDKCEVANLNQHQAWWQYGPYRSVNLYIGGSSHACANSALNANLVTQLGLQGWNFIPTWVGPQAPCTGFRSRISSGPVTAYTQGVAEANSAADVSTALGLNGEVIYYDLEGYGGNTACRQAVSSFMNGWTAQLHARSHISGVYGSSCASNLNDMKTIANIPDGIWLANWIYTGYYSAADVWDVVCVSNNDWSQHQRIRQYSGSHTESWGGVAMTVDSNAVDGIVADANNLPASICPTLGGVILYRAVSYSCSNLPEGNGFVLRGSAGVQNLPNTFLGQVSSVRAPAGWSVMLYEQTNRGGGKKCINSPGDDNFVGDMFDNGALMNDRVASIEVFTTPSCARGAGPDTVAPVGDYAAPINGAIVSRNLPLVAWASDDQSGVKQVRFSATWNGQQTIVYGDLVAPYEYTLDLCAAGVPDGDIELGLKVFDLAGNEFDLTSSHPNLHVVKSYDCSALSATWAAEYWANPSLSGASAWQTNENGVNIFHNWGASSPGGGLPADGWSARFNRTVSFPGGSYRFHCQSSDGCRIYIDDQLRIDAWIDQDFGASEWVGDIPAGNHTIKVEYFDNLGTARLETWWQGPGFLPLDVTCDPQQWCADFWGNLDLVSVPALHRNESDTLRHDWGIAPPDPAFPAGQFSARFERQVDLTCGIYRFHVNSDDGVRLWVGGILRIDQWNDQVAQFSADVNLLSGSHTLKLEYYDNLGAASLNAWWEQLSECPVTASVESSSTSYVQPGTVFDPSVGMRVAVGFLDDARGDLLKNTGGELLGAGATQPVRTYVPQGSTYTFDTLNDPSFRMTAPSSPGTYSSQWSLMVNSNPVSPTATVQVLVDATQPVNVLSSPLGGTYLNTGMISLQANPTDNLSGIQQVVFYAGYDDGNGWKWHELGFDNDGSNGWSLNWNASQVPDQTWVAFVSFAWDKAWNGATTSAWNLTLDRQPPVTTFQPLEAVQNSTKVTLRWTAVEAVSGLDHFDIQMQKDGGAWQDWQTNLSPATTLARFYGELGHQYSFRIRGIDKAGNVESYLSRPAISFSISTFTGDSFELDNSIALAKPITANEMQAHTICGQGDGSWSGDIDWARLPVEAGISYILMTTQLGETTDTVLALYDANGNKLAKNDDIVAGVNLASRIFWTAPQSGFVYLRVQDFDNHVAGSGVTYTLWPAVLHIYYLPMVLH